MVPSPPDDAFVQTSPPDLDERAAERIARACGIEATARALGSHQDRNFLLRVGGDERLLKIANPDTGVDALEAQSAAAERIAGRAQHIRVPRSVAFEPGRTVQTVEHDGHPLHVRALDFLDGSTLSGSGYLSPTVVRALGALAATIDECLADFDAPGVERGHQWDLRRAPSVIAELLPYIRDADLRERVESAAHDAWSAVAPLADSLPVQVIHGDLTDDNVVTRDPLTHVPDGVIDLGDLNRSWTVGEIAVTVSSLLHHDGVDITAALRAVSAYHAIRPLGEEETAALWPLVVLRAATLVASGHHVGATDPGNDYATGNLTHEIALFERAVSVPLAVGTALVRLAVGAEPRWLELPAHGPLLAGASGSDVTVLDLSATSPGLHEGRWLDADAEAAAAWDAPGAVTLTRFGERRLTRSRIGLEEPANVRLGVDLTVGSATDVIAPWPGTVRAVVGGIALHSEGVVLTLDGIRPLVSAGVSVSTGDPLGVAERTLSAQVTAAGVDVPGFVRSSEAVAWRAVVADPTALVLGSALPEPSPADVDTLLARRHEALADVQEHYFAEPPIMVRGWGAQLVDADGRVYVDAVNNVTAIGHAHPRLVAAVTEQWSLLNTNSRFTYPAIVEYSERLAALLPAPLDQVFLVNSGSEAVDLALRIARAWSGRPDVLAMREAYHGWTALSDAVSTSIADNPAALETRPEWVHTVDAPNSYRGTHRGRDARRYAPEAVAEIERLAAAGTPVGAFIAEAFYGNAGGIALPDGYLDAVYGAVRAQGGLAIADEVQVGYGRLGEWFWGFEQQGVVPDIVTVAKAAGNGHPLGAVVTSREIAERYRSQGYFFSSAGGSPVSSVVGTTVLDVIRDERLQENARDTGAYFRSRLEELAERHPLIGAVHGSGLYLGVELVRDRETLEPAAEETLAICERMRELGVIVQPTSDRQCVLKVKPPMCLDRQEADLFVDALDRVLTTGW
jgi:4-aminobutyrate aminotransferase-like enzyme/Ser/Thr protein kinase RdoA (MazF antagonist)